MTLSYEQILPLTRGAAFCEQAEDGIHFHRFTQEQEALYEAHERTDFYKKALTTAGVRLDFVTDSRTLSLDAVSYYGFSSHTYPHFSFSVLCNGERIGAFGCHTTPDCSLFASFTLPKGAKRITVCFPWPTNGVLRALTLDDGATVTPAPAPAHRMIMLGDSITHGYYASEPHLCYAARLTDALDAEVRNKAIGGEIFLPALGALPDGDFAPDLITVAYGTNDAARTTQAEFEENCRGFFENLSRSYPNAKIFALTPIWRPGCEEGDRCEFDFFHVSRFMAQVCKALPNVTLLDGYDFVPHDTDLLWDAVTHPNDAGFAHYADRLHEAMKPHLS